MLDLQPLSAAVTRVCAEHWPPLPRRCVGCPLERPCGTWVPTTVEGIRTYIDRMNTQAAQCEDSSASP